MAIENPDDILEGMFGIAFMTIGACIAGMLLDIVPVHLIFKEYSFCRFLAKAVVVGAGAIVGFAISAFLNNKE